MSSENVVMTWFLVFVGTIALIFTTIAAPEIDAKRQASLDLKNQCIAKAVNAGVKYNWYEGTCFLEAK